MRILIVKLGAMGDVMRTTPLLEALDRRYPGAHVTWLVEPACREALEGNERIDELWEIGPEAERRLRASTFDLAACLDKDDAALDAVMAARSARKAGFGRDAAGRLAPLTPESEYAVRLGLDDDLKFRRNQKTYQQITFEQVGLEFAGEEYAFVVTDADRAAARSRLEALGLCSGRGPVIGLNTGSGPRFAGKRLPEETHARLADLFAERLGARVLLLGGEDELERNARIAARSRRGAIHAGAHPLKVFAGIVSECDLVVTGDTIAMHVAIAMKVPSLVCFGSTCASEIELYGRGAKVVSQLPCAPCYLRDCPIQERCMAEMDPEKLYETALPFVEARA